MKVAAGEEIRWKGETFRVVVVRPLAVELRDNDGDTIEVDLDEVQRHTEHAQGSVLPAAKLSWLEDDLHSDLRQWVEAIERIEGAARGQRDDVIEQEVASLSRGLGKSVSVRTVERKLSAYRRDGVAGLADGRKGASRPSVDTRVVEAINVVLARQSRASTRSKSVALDEIAHYVRKEFGDEVELPSRATLYRVLESEEVGRHSFGSAKTRESLSLQPDRAFGFRSALRPGEQVQIDTSPLDVMVRIDEATIGRPELTILLDVATRSILAAVLRPGGTRSMDLVVVLARALVPYSHRPEGIRETRRLISTAWADEALIDQERLERLRDAQPFIFPETITTDRGKNYLSKHFRAVCERLGISMITAAPHTPTDKPHVERTFESITTLFQQYVKGYVGRSAEHRGRDVGAQSEELLSIAQMQELLEDWIAVEWQNRSHDSLRDPLHPTISLSPNEMCRAFRHVAPELHVPLTNDDYIAMLPITYRRVNRYGVTIDHRVYDSARLAHIRRRESPLPSKKGRWPVRVDPYNLHVVWLEADGEFIPLRWANDVHAMPMLGDVWRHARDEYRNKDDAQDQADRRHLVDAMKTFAKQGNPEKPKRRAARQRARAKAVAADPMNHTSVRNTVADEPAPAEDAPPEATKESWPHRGGFELIQDPMDEVRWRLEN